MNNLQQKKMNVKICDPWETMLSLIFLMIQEDDKESRRDYGEIMLEALKELTVKEDK